MSFPGMGNLSSDDCLLNPGRVPPPVGRPRARSRTRREESRPAHRLMSSTGYSWRVALQHCPLRFTGCRHSAMNESCRSTDLQRTANCVLTICLTSGGKRRSNSPPASRHRRAQVRRRSCGARFSMPAFLAHSLTTCQTTRSVTPFPQVLPARQTHRKTRPSVTPADTSHESMTFLTQSGTGTVRTCRALPTRSTMAQ